MNTSQLEKRFSSDVRKNSSSDQNRYSFKIKINIKYVLNNIENILESNKSRHKVNKVLPGNFTLNNNAFTA